MESFDAHFGLKVSMDTKEGETTNMPPLAYEKLEEFKQMSV